MNLENIVPEVTDYLFFFFFYHSTLKGEFLWILFV